MEEIQKNKIIIITGGSRGIGKCLVEELAGLGYTIIFTYNESQEKAKEIQELCTKQGYNVENYKVNASKKEEIKEFAKIVLEKYKNIDVLINNAGISQTKIFQDITDQDWDNIINTNLSSVFYMTREILPNMIQNKKGCIINISSIWGLVGASCEVHYSVSKAGIDGLTKALAKEVGASNIRVNSIAPGTIYTDMNKMYTKVEMDEIVQEIPLQKIGNPKDIARCVKWLIEDEYTTGQIISPNGGWII